MEYQESPEQQKEPSLKPSKHFLVRGAVATAIVAIVLIAQTSWVKGLFTKDAPEVTLSHEKSSTVGDILEKDSNNNTIPDWEERLWGLDPTTTTTNGISNKAIIEGKRGQLGTGEQATPLNETDKIARDLFTFSNALGQESNVSSGDLGALAGKLAEQGPQKNTLPVYMIKNIATVKTTAKTLEGYRTQLLSVLSTYDGSLPEIELLVSSLENGDFSQLEALDKTIAFYRAFSKKLAAIKTPVGVAEYHLQIVNSIAGAGRAFQKIQSAQDNGINALVGLAEYRDFDAQLTQATQKLTTYLQQYGIL